MRFNEWAIFIKESSDWHVNKYYWVDCNLIERHDDNNDDSIDKIEVMSLLWYL